MVARGPADADACVRRVRQVRSFRTVLKARLRRASRPAVAGLRGEDASASRGSREAAIGPARSRAGRRGYSPSGASACRALPGGSPTGAPPPPRRCPAPAGKRVPARYVPTMTASHELAGPSSSRRASSYRSRSQSRALAALASLTRWRCAPPLSSDLARKDSAPIRRTGEKRGSGRVLSIAAA
jgi:hypothetical protein